MIIKHYLLNICPLGRDRTSSDQPDRQSVYRRDIVAG
jgi:hypothetical protein